MIRNKNLILGLSISVLMLLSLFMGSSSSVNLPDKNDERFVLLADVNSAGFGNAVSGQAVYYPSSPPDLLTRSRTHKFILKTQNVPENNATNIDQIYYRLAAIRILDPSLGNLTQSLKQFWIDQILSFQRASGGFGTWQYDYSSLSSTYKAVQSLKWLGYTGLNETAVLSYLDRLRNTLTNGYNSHLRDTDSDVYSTYLAVLTYNALGKTPPNATAVAQVFIKAQNIGANVSNVEVGGFGKQTNRFANPPVYWTSEVTISRAALVGLRTLNYTLDTVINKSAALNFLRSLQDPVTGGWFNTPYDATLVRSMSAAHVEAALDAITLLGGTPSDPVAAQNFLLSLETPDGGFRLTNISTKASLKGTFFSLKALELLGANPSNVTKTLQWLLNWIPQQGGFGGFPGDDPSLRETFDAVYALSLAGHPIPHVQDILNFVSSYRNPDGGYGLTGSNVESTFRAVTIYSLLGEPFPNASQTIAFLQGLQQSDGGFIKRPGAGPPSYVISTYRAVAALHLLNATPSNVLGAIAFLQSNQNSDGGFGGFNYGTNRDTSDVSSTYRAVRALYLLNATPLNVQGAIEFLQQSQNPDGGFKRGSYVNTLPKNVSGAVYTYSAVRALQILGSTPLNISGLYSFITSLRNADGGFGEHPAFTSDIAYTFTSFWLLSRITEISGFRLTVPDNLGSSSSSLDNFTIAINGAIGPFSHVVLHVNSSTTLVNGTITTPSNITIDISTLNLSSGTHVFEVTVSDGTGATINVTISLLIGSSTTTSSPNNSSSSLTSSTTSDVQTTSSSSNNNETTPASSSQNVAQTSNASTELSMIGMLLAIGFSGVLLSWRRRLKSDGYGKKL